jgi:hypothetical protein
MRALMDSMALVVHTTRRISTSKFRNGTNSAHALFHSLTIAGYLRPQAASNSINRSRVASSVGAVYTGRRACCG